MRFTVIVIGLLSVSWLCGLAAAESQSPPDPGSIDEWIEQLNSDAFWVRERASENLRRAGSAALDPLAKAAESPVPEVSARAARILLELSETSDREVALVALQRLAHLDNRRWEREAAIAVLERIQEEKAVAELNRMGATVRGEHHTGGGIIVLELHLGDEYRGGDEGLKYVGDLKSLQTLRVYHAPITDQGLKKLDPPPGLALAQFYGTQVTDEGLNAFREAFPEIHVDFGRGAFLGVRGLEPPNPAQVSDVIRGSAADAAGILRGDVITKVDGQPVKNFQELKERIGKHRAGDKATLEVSRNGQNLTKKVVLGRWQ